MEESKKAASEQKHKERMKRQKAAVDAKVEQADLERGIVVINTGNGKGKSSSGFGMVARALGHNMKVAVVQFIKGSFSTGEEAFFRRFPDEVTYHVMGEGFTWETQNKARDIEVAEKAWRQARDLLLDADYDLVLLDELNIATQIKYLDIDTVIEDLKARPLHQHVVITGRGANKKLVEYADTVTDMVEVKHAFKAGIKAQKGIEL